VTDGSLLSFFHGFSDFFGVVGIERFIVFESAEVHQNVTVLGSLFVAGFKQFRIDHPLDPANKYLSQLAWNRPISKPFTMESPN
jgi:hypothetical protein